MEGEPTETPAPSDLSPGARNESGTPPVCRLHAVVRGRVQGVGFRVFAREAGLRHRCRGWVRNRRDGSVELEVEGLENDLTELLTELYRGPVLARVEDIQLQWSHGPGRYVGFQILR